MDAVAEPDLFCSDIYAPKYYLDVNHATDHGPGYPDERPNPDHLSLPASDSRQDEVTGHYHEVEGNLYDSEDSIGHCVSIDFKKSAGSPEKSAAATRVQTQPISSTH